VLLMSCMKWVVSNIVIVSVVVKMNVAVLVMSVLVMVIGCALKCVVAILFGIFLISMLIG